jgi:3-dehydrotetronate 4-kinase
MTILLGCIADDFTGATDLANNLVRCGMRVVQTIGIPADPLTERADAVVVALKSRTIEARDAVRQSLDALSWLQAQGARQFYFKVCSTFDSTAEGNIGPVTDALMDALACDFAVVTPAFPDNGRTVFKGHLFVGDVLLSDSGMRDHPLTPMTDANLVRVMQSQSRQKVGLIDHVAVGRSADAIAERVASLRAEGVRLAIADAISNDDLMRLGEAVKGDRFMTAGSGLAIGLPQNFGIEAAGDAARLPGARGFQAIVSGSCSIATNRQVAAFKNAGHPALGIDPMRIAAGEDVAASALQWAAPHLQGGPVLVYSSADPETVRQIQGQLGGASAGALVEATLARVAAGLVQLGVGQLVVAGGETSGACVQALAISRMRIGPQIDPGVPWCYAEVAPARALASGRSLPAGGSAALPPDGSNAAIHLALKSGNFGADDFFTRAFTSLKAVS